MTQYVVIKKVHLYLRLENLEEKKAQCGRTRVDKCSDETCSYQICRLFFSWNKNRYLFLAHAFMHFFSHIRLLNENFNILARCRCRRLFKFLMAYSRPSQRSNKWNFFQTHICNCTFIINRHSHTNWRHLFMSKFA